MATKFEKSTALFNLADQVALVSINLFKYRLAVQQKLPLPKVKRLRGLEDDLDAKTTELRAAAIGAVTDEVAGELAEVTAATVKAQKVITKIAQIEQAIKVATAVIGLGVAVRQQACSAAHARSSAPHGVSRPASSALRTR